MKKILSILTLITLIGSSSTTVVACGTNHASASVYHNGVLNLK